MATREAPVKPAPPKPRARLSRRRRSRRRDHPAQPNAANNLCCRLSRRRSAWLTVQPFRGDALRVSKAAKRNALASA